MSARTGLPWLWLAGVAIAADQASKLWITATFQLFETRALLPVLSITRAHNTGAAFSFLAGAAGWQRWFFVTLALVVSLAITLWLRRLDDARQRMLAIALALVMGGAIGNVLDRLRLGHVVDFIQVHWDGHYFPVFNVADICISVGAGLLLLDAWLDYRREKNGREKATNG